MDKADTLKVKLISMVNNMPEDKLCRLYKVLSSVPFMDKLQAGEELTDKEMQAVEQHLHDNLK